MTFKTRLFWMLALTTALAACGGDDGAMGPEGPEGPEGPRGPGGSAGGVGPEGPSGPPGGVGPTGPEGPTGPAPSVNVDTVEPGDDCAFGGVSVTIGTAEPVLICNGATGAAGSAGAPGAAGAPGENGATPSVEVTPLEAGDTRCGDAGGVAIVVTVDEDVVAEEVVCNGADGTNGTNGTNGADGATPSVVVDPIAPSEEGVCGLAGGSRVTFGEGDDEVSTVVCNGAAGADGDDGDDGRDGATAFRVTSLEPGEGGCAEGGILVETLDIDGDPESSFSVCNGSTGPAGPMGPPLTVAIGPAPSCTNGGVTVILGSEAPFVVCNGADGETPSVTVETIGAGEEGCTDGGYVLIVDTERYPICVGATAPPVCGDGITNGDEVCDGADLGGLTCQTQGFASGILACNGTCDAVDTGLCVAWTFAINEVTSTNPDEVEFVNYGTSAIDVSGWYWTDDELNRANPYVFPEGSIIPAGGFVSFINGTDFSFGIGGTDEINLLDSFGNLIDSTGWTTGEAATSWCRIPDGTGDFQSCTAQTFGETNVIPEPSRAFLRFTFAGDTLAAALGTGNFGYDGTATPTFVAGPSGSTSRGYNASQWPLTGFDEEGPYFYVEFSNTGRDDADFTFRAYRSATGATKVTTVLIRNPGFGQLVDTIATDTLESGTTWYQFGPHALPGSANVGVAEILFYFHDSGAGTGTARITDIELSADELP
jgi:hypothetical protein